KNVFAFQGMGGSFDQANQNLVFVPPLSCQTPKIIDNIPLIDEIGNLNFSGTINIVTQTGATLNFTINGIEYTASSLPGGVNLNGPSPVAGNTNYETYFLTGLSGNIKVTSTGELYLSYYGTNGNATYGGYYSGFTFKPEIGFNPLGINVDNCIPNVELAVNTLSPFDTYQWFFNDVAIDGANASSYTPNQLGPGYYFVSATILDCLSNIISDKIPVSSCPTDIDNDGINDNIDLDLDNDGIANCVESFGNQPLDLSNPLTGVVSNNTYSNSFTATITTSGTATPAANPLVSNQESFVTETGVGRNNSVNYT
uniref:hypothetical protein n=1 Tax=Microcystis aeruginosa TaxID=1126 RepID=UPI000AD55C51